MQTLDSLPFSRIRRSITSGGCVLHYRPISHSVLLAATSALRVALGVGDLGTVSNAGDAQKMAMSDGERTFTLAQFAAALGWLRFGLGFEALEADGKFVVSEVKRPSSSRATPEQWLAYAQAVEEEASDVVTPDDVSAVVEAASKAFEKDVDAEKNG